MPDVFHPTHSALDQIFAQKMQFIIPEYQRPYSWQAEGKSDRNNQINQMWDDLWSFFKEMEDDKEYFLGSMVIIERKLRTLEVVDGQQRLTSLMLLFTAMRCFLEHRLTADGDAALAPELRQYVERAKNKLGELVYNEQNIGFAPELKVKIARSAGYDFDAVLGDAAGCKDKSIIAKVSKGDPKFEEIARRYFDNRDYFIEQLKATFLDRDGRFGTVEFRGLNDFFTFLQTRVAIVLIKTTDFETAYSIFEILNNRGLPLTNTDLFRNFVINRFTEQTKVDGGTAWYRLESEYALTEDFTARWVESKTGSKQRQSAFNGIQRIYKDEYAASPINSQIEVFYADLERDLGYYSLVVEPDGRITDPRVRNSIRFIGALGNLRYSTTLLLSVFRHFRYTGDAPTSEMLALLIAYERYALSIWLQPRKRFSSSSIYQSIRHLRDRRVAAASEAFALDDSELLKLSESLDGPVGNDVARLLLAVLVWMQEERAEDVVTQRLDIGRVTLEHIIPVSPAANTNWMTDFSAEFRADYTQRLGNMTLLTSKMNSAANNSDFTKKKVHYAKTLLGLTHELAQLETITQAFIAARHARIVKALRDRWALPA
jgi:Protein of unknown function DUF262/Protein of unknown function (DUF1524)